MARHSTNFDWNTLPPVLRVISIVVSIAVTAIAGAGAYYTIVGRIDRLDTAMTLQGKVLEQLASSVKTLAERAATQEEVGSMIERACLQMQIRNQAKGWVCPFSGVPTPVVRRAASPKAETKDAPGWYLFGASK